MFGPSIALAIGAKFVPLRKPGKLPGMLISCWNLKCDALKIVFLSFFKTKVHPAWVFSFDPLIPLRLILENGWRKSYYCGKIAWIWVEREITELILRIQEKADHSLCLLSMPDVVYLEFNPCYVSDSNGISTLLISFCANILLQVTFPSFPSVLERYSTSQITLGGLFCGWMVREYVYKCWIDLILTPRTQRHDKNIHILYHVLFSSQGKLYLQGALWHFERNIGLLSIVNDKF